MYLFVRYTGIVILVAGILLMLVGFGGAVYTFALSDTVLQFINSQFLVQSGAILPEQFSWSLRLVAASLGLLLFLAGMVASALGQLMLVFIDIAVSTRETNNLLRALRSSDRPL